MHLYGLEQEVIKTYQAQLNKRGFGPLVVDGIRGPKTIEAIKKFQASAGLVVDGIAGPKTLTALAQPIKTDNTPLLTTMQQPTASGVDYQTQSPPALPTGTTAPLPPAPTGTVYAPPPTIVEVPKASAPPAQGGNLMPLLLAGAAALALVAMG